MSVVRDHDLLNWMSSSRMHIIDCVDKAKVLLHPMILDRLKIFMDHHTLVWLLMVLQSLFPLTHLFVFAKVMDHPVSWICRHYVLFEVPVLACK